MVRRLLSSVVGCGSQDHGRGTGEASRVASWRPWQDRTTPDPWRPWRPVEAIRTEPTDPGRPYKRTDPRKADPGDRNQPNERPDRTVNQVERMRPNERPNDCIRTDISSERFERVDRTIWKRNICYQFYLRFSKLIPNFEPSIYYQSFRTEPRW